MPQKRVSRIFDLRSGDAGFLAHPSGNNKIDVGDGMRRAMAISAEYSCGAAKHKGLTRAAKRARRSEALAAEKARGKVRREVVLEKRKAKRAEAARNKAAEKRPREQKSGKSRLGRGRMPSYAGKVPKSAKEKKRRAEEQREDVEGIESLVERREKVQFVQEWSRPDWSTSQLRRGETRRHRDFAYPHPTDLHATGMFRGQGPEEVRQVRRCVREGYRQPETVPDERFAVKRPTVGIDPGEDRARRRRLKRAQVVLPSTHPRSSLRATHPYTQGTFRRPHIFEPRFGTFKFVPARRRFR